MDMLCHDINGAVRHDLCKVAMKQDVLCLTSLTNFCNWLERSDFVVRTHDRYQTSLIANRRRHIVRRYPALLVDRHICDPVPFALQLPKRFKNCRMLNDTRDQVSFFRSGPRCTQDRHIIGLCATPRKYDFAVASP